MVGVFGSEGDAVGGDDRGLSGDGFLAGDDGFAGKEAEGVAVGAEAEKDEVEFFGKDGVVIGGGGFDGQVDVRKVDLALGDFQRREQGFADHALVATVVGRRYEAVVAEVEVDLAPVDGVAVVGDEDLVEFFGGGSTAESDGESIAGGGHGADKFREITGHALGKGFGVRESVEIHADIVDDWLIRLRVAKVAIAGDTGRKSCQPQGDSIEYRRVSGR